MKKLLLTVVISSLYINDCYAFNYLNWGIAFDYPSGGQYSDVQTYSLGVQEPVFKTLDLFAEVGGWKDKGHYEGAMPGGFVSTGVSLDLKMHEHYASYSLGPALIGPPDTLLGSEFQIYHKLSFGWNQENKRIGFFLKHFSNAGLTGGTNYGRNFYGLEIAF